MFIGPYFFMIFLLNNNFSGTAIAKNNSLEKIGIQNEFENTGRQYFIEGKYNEAEAAFVEADNPKYWIYEGQPNAVARYWLRGVYVVTGKYEKAIENLEELLKILPNEESFLEEKKQYDVLIKYHNDKNIVPVLKYIEQFKKKNSNFLPPVNYNPIASIGIVSTILRLYDTIGDHDAGIAFIDECLKYFKEQDIKKYGEYKPGKADEEYLKVREAFEQDKAQGTKGRATKALIQSDYFPW